MRVYCTQNLLLYLFIPFFLILIFPVLFVLRGAKIESADRHNIQPQERPNFKSKQCLGCLAVEKIYVAGYS